MSRRNNNLYSASGTDNNRCIAECGVRSDVLASGIGLCGKEVHPTCAGMSNNWCRTREFDEFFQFKCEDCRGNEWRNISLSFQKLADLQSSIVEVMKAFSAKLEKVNANMESIKFYIDDEIKATNASVVNAKASHTAIVQELKAVNSVLSTLKDISSNNASMDSTANIATALNQKLDQLKLDISKTLVDEIQFYGSNSKPKKIRRERKKNKKVEATNKAVTVGDQCQPAVLPENPKIEWKFLHVSNLSPTTTTIQLREFIDENFPITSYLVINSLLKKEKKRCRDGIDSVAFKVGLPKQEVHFLKILSSWPEGVKVRPFYLQNRWKSKETT